MILKRMKKTQSMNWVVLAVLVAEMLFSVSIKSKKGALTELIGLLYVRHDRSAVMTTLICGHDYTDACLDYYVHGGDCAICSCRNDACSFSVR